MLLKKRKMDNFRKKKNGKGLEISPSALGKWNEKKFQTSAMWSTQMCHWPNSNFRIISGKC